MEKGHFVRVFGEKDAYFEGIFVPTLSDDQNLVVRIVGGPMVRVRWDKTLKVSFFPFPDLENKTMFSNQGV